MAHVIWVTVKWINVSVLFQGDSRVMEEQLKEQELLEQQKRVRVIRA